MVSDVAACSRKGFFEGELVGLHAGYVRDAPCVTRESDDGLEGRGEAGEVVQGQCGGLVFAAEAEDVSVPRVFRPLMAVYYGSACGGVRVAVDLDDLLSDRFSLPDVVFVMRVCRLADVTQDVLHAGAGLYVYAYAF